MELEVVDDVLQPVPSIVGHGSKSATLSFGGSMGLAPLCLSFIGVSELVILRPSS